MQLIAANKISRPAGDGSGRGTFAGARLGVNAERLMSREKKERSVSAGAFCGKEN